MTLEKNEYVQNPFHSIVKQYQKNPNKICLIFENKKITYQYLLKQIFKFSKKLKNLKKGEKVLIITDDPFKHIVSVYSCFFNLLVPMPYLAENLNKLNEMIKQTKCKLVVSDQRIKIKNKKLLLLINEKNILRDKISDQKILNKYVAANKVAMIYFTSGTTSGINKGVLQTFNNLEFTKKHILKKTQINNNIIEIICTPIFNSFWFGRLNSIFSVGGTLVFYKNSFNPIIFFNLINKFKINSISGDTAIYLFLLKFFKKNLNKICKKILWIKIASQPMPLDKRKELMKIFSKTKIVLGYGLTEAMRTTLLSFYDEKKFLNSDGKPTNGIIIKILNNNNENLGRNKIGNVFIKGSHVAKGYLNKNKLWKDRIYRGFYKSGDLGILNSKGYLYLKGRADDAINISGQTVSLNEVDERLKKLIKKTNFISIGVNDPLKVSHKKLVICIENKWKEKVSWNNLRGKLLKINNKSFIPDEVYIARKIPKTNNGKIKYAEIRKNISKKKYEKLI